MHCATQSVSVETLKNREIRRSIVHVALLIIRLRNESKDNNNERVYCHT